MLDWFRDKYTSFKSTIMQNSVDLETQKITLSPIRKFFNKTANSFFSFFSSEYKQQRNALLEKTVFSQKPYDSSALTSSFKSLLTRFATDTTQKKTTVTIVTNAVSEDLADMVATSQEINKAYPNKTINIHPVIETYKFRDPQSLSLEIQNTHVVYMPLVTLGFSMWNIRDTSVHFATATMIQSHEKEALFGKPFHLLFKAGTAQAKQMGRESIHNDISDYYASENATLDRPSVWLP